jgi:hypothetical protein
MSIRSVERSIRQALSDNKLTKAEAEDIVATAEKGPVTTGEAERIVDLYQKGVWYMPGHFPHGALPQPRPPQYEAEPGAHAPLLNFFIEQRVPEGSMYKPVKEDIEAALKNIDYSGLALDEAPKTHNLHHVHLRDMRMVDGPRTDAYVDTQRDEFYLKTTGAGMAGPHTIGPFWHGPIPLKELNPTERVSEKLDAWTLAQDMGLNTTRTHTPRLTDIQDLGDGEFEIEMSAVNWQDPTDVRDVKRAVVNDEGSFLRVVADPTQGGGNVPLTPARLQDMKDAFNREFLNLNFAVDGLPMGPQFERVLLRTEPGFDTFSYYALVPAGAMHPNAPGVDLNDAKHIFIERTGGFAGMTMYAGPVDID